MNWVDINWLDVFLKVFVGVVSTLMVGLILWLLKRLNKVSILPFRKDYKQKRAELCEQSAYYRLFSPYFKKKDINYHYYALASKEIDSLKLKDNYAIIGDGGLGKSSYLINDFYKINPITYHKIFLNSADIINFDSANINCEKLGKVILYLDGLDEVSDNVNKIKEIIQFYKQNARSFVIKISCRGNFFYRYIKTLLNDVGINNITIVTIKKEGCDFMNFLLKNLKRDLKPEYAKGLKDLVFDKKDFNSEMPLFNIFYVYKKLILGIDDDSFTDLYSYYNSFITEYYHKEYENMPVSASDLDGLATIIFKHYHNGTRISKKDLEKYNVLKALIYKTTSDSVTFIHQSFFEYFLAKYIINLFKETSALNYSKLFEYFNQESENDLSDIIRDGINNMPVEDKQKICANLFKCYEITLSNDLNNKLLNTHKNISTIIEKYGGKGDTNFDTKTIPDYHDIMAKKEIILRFSRITGLPHDFLKAQLDYLKFIYYNDTAIINEDINEDINKKIADVKCYFRVILKRWSAIGASWLASELGGDEIEIDYIEKMLKEPGDNNYYDFANRSNTLLYYGDIKSCNILTFADTNTRSDWSNAGEKRLKRLQHALDSNILKNTPVSADEKSAIKYYRFRAFDLATIYTFLLSRKKQYKDFTDRYKKYYDTINALELQYASPDNADEERKSMISRRNELMQRIQTNIKTLFETFR